MKTLWKYPALVVLCIFLIPWDASSKQPCYTGVITIPAASMQPRFNTYNINNVGGFVDSDSTGHVNFYAPLVLPNGARITKVEMDAYDISDTASIDVTLRRSQYGASGSLVKLDTTAAAAPGDQRYTQDNLDIVIDNLNYSYYFDLHFWNVGSTSNRFYRLIVYFELFECPGSVVVIPLN
jgi:hypothetical protein